MSGTTPAGGRPRLILVEGIPGTGKSTTAQFLARHLARQGTPVRWWYEEERGHPLHVFDDPPSLRRVVDDLFSGRHRRVVEAVQGRWRALATTLSRSDATFVMDGMLLGHLTWSLFPADVPAREIGEYVREAATAVRSYGVRVVYLYAHDLAGALQRICDHRGGQTREHFIRRATECPYGVRRGLAGFDGLVAYWTAYQDLCDSLLASASLPTLPLEIDSGDWVGFRRRITHFLGLPPPPAEAGPRDPSLARCPGRYRRVGSEADEDPLPGRAGRSGRGQHAPGVEQSDGVVGEACEVCLEGGELYLSGPPHVWRRTRLLPRQVARLAFDLESLPFRVEFEADAAGLVRALCLSGSALISGAVDGRYARTPSDG